MEPEYTDDIELGVSVSPDNIVELTLGGNASAYLHKAELIAWLHDTTRIFTEQLAKHGGHAMSLVDISMLRDFDEEAMELMRDFANNPMLRNVKSAVIGGSLFSNMALRTIIVMTGRVNIKSFDTRAEGIAWLKDSRPT